MRHIDDGMWKSLPVIRRRTFLCGTSLIAVNAAMPSFAIAQAPARSTDPLILFLSDNGNQILIAHKNGGAGSLRIAAAQFGPDARFRLSRPFQEHLLHHEILIDRAAHGRLYDLSEKIVLSRKSEKLPWQIAYVSAIFGSFKTIPFLDFALGAAMATALPSGQLNAQLKKVSDGRISIAGSANWRIELSADFSFGLFSANAEKSDARFLGGRVGGIGYFDMRWQSAARDIIITSPADFHKGLCVGIPLDDQPVHEIKADPGDKAIALADALGRSVEFRPLDLQRPENGNPAAIRVLLKPDKKKTLKIAAYPNALTAILLPRCQMSIAETDAPGEYASLTLADLTLVERAIDGAADSVMIAATAMLRTGEDVSPAPQKRDKKAGKANKPDEAEKAGNRATFRYRPVEFNAPAGYLLVGSNLDLAGPDKSDKTEPEVKKAAASGDEKGCGVVSGSITVAGDYQNYHDLVLLGGVANPLSTFRLRGQGPAGHDAKPVRFSSIVMSATLYEIDRALPGTDWSLLSFGHATGNRADIATGSGTPLDLTYPAPDAMAGGLGSVMTLFATPDPEAQHKEGEQAPSADLNGQTDRGRLLGRLALDRARLDIAIDRKLVDLRFGFRGLTLMLFERGSVIVAANVACGVIEAPDGTIVDTRPVIMLDFPPQHVMEEAWYLGITIEGVDDRLTQAISKAQATIAKLLETNKDTAENDTVASSTACGPGNQLLVAPQTALVLARVREEKAGSADPVYAIWRDFWQQMRSRQLAGETLTDKNVSLEYFAPNNRDALTKEIIDELDANFERIRKEFVTALAKPANPQDWMNSRLSKPSRLAFHVNCGPATDTSEIGFSFAELTRLSRYEPAVARLARRLVKPKPNGEVPRADRAEFILQGPETLAFHQIEGGPRTIFSHMDAVRRALAGRPDEHETALELVSRLTLSPSQRAIFLRPGDVPPELYISDMEEGGETHPPLDPLWTLDLVTTPGNPADIRVVNTPDYRGEALQPWVGLARDPAYKAPTFGNAAPWRLPRTVKEQIIEPDGSANQCEARATAIEKEGLLAKVHAFFCSREDDPATAKIFRTGLSANDRHQLFLLTSAPGLPVKTANLSGGETNENASLFSVPDNYKLAEIDAPLAFYDPRPLSVQELSLTARGATFRHDSHFSPPLPAILKHPTAYCDATAFDGLSLKRWQHHSVLGRDMVDLVAYQGYLMPCGHPATLTKITEREIRITCDGDLRAVLVQRFFVSLSKPILGFPRIEQPNFGRGFCPGDVTVKLSGDGKINDPSTSGGGSLGIEIGLAFWPMRAGTVDPLTFDVRIGEAAANVEMLFVDRVAAGNPKMLQDLGEAYNNDLGHRNVWFFSGGTLPYAKARRPGDTSFPTDSLVLKVIGLDTGAGETAASWVPPSLDYEFTPNLNGLDLPPFFPAISEAHIRLDTVGQLTGAIAPVATAYFDGHYIKNGLSVGDEDPVEGNQLDIYMHFGLSEDIKLAMGANGDRTGGLSRPEMNLCCLSRTQGPLGFENPSFQSGPNELRKPIDQTTLNNLKPGQYLSIAANFNQSQKFVPLATDPDNSAPQQKPKANKLAGDCFSLDAKILGIIDFRELLGHVVGSDIMSELLPILEEVVEFGLAVEQTIEETKQFLLQPVSAKLAEFEAAWKAADRAILEKAAQAGSRVPQYSLAILFPQIAQAKIGLRTVVDAALAEQNVLNLPKRMSALYEAGRALVEALAEFAAHPDAQLEAGLRAIIETLIGTFINNLVAFGLPEALAEPLKKALLGDPDPLREAVADRLSNAIVNLASESVDTLLDNPLIARLMLLPWPDLVVYARGISKDANELEAILKEHAKKINLPNENALKAGLKTILEDPAQLPSTVSGWLLPKDGDVDKAIKSIKDNTELEKETIELAVPVLEAYKTELVAIRSALIDATAPDQQFVRSYRIAKARLDEIQRQVTATRDNLRQLGQALADIKPRDALAALAALVYQVIGRPYDADIQNFIDKLRKEIKALAEPVKNLAKPPQEAVDICITNKTDSARADAIAKAKPGTFDPPLQHAKITIDKAGDLLAKVKNAIEEIENTDLAGKPELKPIFDTVTATEGYLKNVRLQSARFFCGAVDLMLAAQADLGSKPGTTPSGQLVLLDLAALQAAIMEAERALNAKMVPAITKIGKLTVEYLGENAPILLGAAALGTLADAVKDEADSVIQAVEDLKDRADKWAAQLVDLINWPLTLAGAIAKKISDQLVELNKVIPGALKDDRTKDLLTEIDSAFEKLAESFTEFTAPTGIIGLDRLLKAHRTVKGQQQTIRSLIQNKDATPLISEPMQILNRIQGNLQALLQHSRNRIDGLPKKVREEFDDLAKVIIAPVLGGNQGLLRRFDDLIEARNGLIDNIGKQAPWLSVLAIEALKPPDGDQDRLVEDRDRIKAFIDEKARSGPGKPSAIDTLVSDDQSRRELADLIDKVAGAECGVAQIAGRISDLISKIERGALLELIDIATLKNQIANALNDLIPVKRSLTYDHRIDISKGKKDDLFSPDEGCFFRIGMKSTFDLLKRDDFTFQVSGALGPFSVNLLQRFEIDAIRLYFGGISFRAGRGVKFALDVDFKDFEIGKDLETIQKLQESLGIGAAGLNVDPLLGRSGIRVSYGVDIGVITLGTVSFSNVSVYIGADLPFDNGPAIFNVSMSRRMAPFMVSIAPWAGSGYLTILATAKTIVGFEFGMEAGFGGAFQIGPLVGKGRIQAGIAVRTIKLENYRATEISGTFFAGGSASLWIFQFSASLYVRLTMNSATGEMRGEAIFTFSFKRGFVKFSFQVRAAYGQDKLGGSGGSGQGRKAQVIDGIFERLPGEQPVRYAQAEPLVMNDATQEAHRKAEKRDTRPLISAEAVSDTKSLAEDWETYSSYFDMSVLEAG